MQHLLQVGGRIVFIAGGLKIPKAGRKMPGVKKKRLRIYHAHIQLGIVAQGLLQALAVLEPVAVWRNYGSWLRTVWVGVPPSERAVALALRNTLPQFLADTDKTAFLAKFVRKRIDLGRAEVLKLAS